MRQAACACFPGGSLYCTGVLAPPSGDFSSGSGDRKESRRSSHPAIVEDNRVVWDS